MLNCFSVYTFENDGIMSFDLILTRGNVQVIAASDGFKSFRYRLTQVESGPRRLPRVYTRLIETSR